MPKPRQKIPPNGELRQSQLLSTFGPGAMVDLPDCSVVISGLSYWKGERLPVHEDRLRAKIREILKTDANVLLYTPPIGLSEPDMARSSIAAFVFPTWFLVQLKAMNYRQGKVYRTRPLIPWNAMKGGCRFEGKKYTAVPVRFVQACVNGHLSDLSWQAFAHNDFSNTCSGQLWLDEAGSGNDFTEIYVRCEKCGAEQPLSRAKQKDSKVLGQCNGQRPWLKAHKESCVAHKMNPQTGTLEPTEKREYNRLLVRSASNAYFSQRLSVISLPEGDQLLRNAVNRFANGELEQVDQSMLEMMISRMDRFAELRPFGVEAVWAELERRKGNNNDSSQGSSIKKPELQVLLNCPLESESKPQTNDVDFEAYARDVQDLSPQWQPWLDKVVLIHRLREVIAQVGFTRFEASPPNINGELDINVRLADLDFKKEWVPAIENRGEGIFFALNRGKVEEWLQRPAVKQRGQQLLKGYYAWLDQRQIVLDQDQEKFFPGLPYILLHSLAHLLITSVSLECGYAASAIRERIYADDELGYGILLHTGSTGSEGTLGGLVHIGRKLEHHLTQALALAKLCSNDPICAGHNPANQAEERFLHGAACHGCLLIAETSCEKQNEYLDRALVINTVTEENTAFFPDSILI